MLNENDLSIKELHSPIAGADLGFSKKNSKI